MNLDKKKYKKSEVEKLLDSNSSDFEQRIAELRGRIAELIDENKKLSMEVVVFKEKEASIVSALTDSEEKAKEIKEKSELEYSLTVQKLKTFNSRWEKYFEVLKEKYPLYPAVINALKLKEKLDLLFETGDNKKIVEDFSKELSLQDGNKDDFFEPKQKIVDYIAATNDNGFNLDEVLNPGTLHLEDLCKELGLIEEKE